MEKEKPMPVTRESVEAAKQARDREREMVYRLTGVRITDDGRIILGAQQ